MECINDVFLVIIYLLLAILLVVLIVLGIKTIRTLKKVDKVVDDVNYKVNRLNGVFDLVDSTTDALAMVSDKIVGFVSSGISNLFHRKRKSKEEMEDE